MKKILFLLLLVSSHGFAQKPSKADKKLATSLKTHIEILASDSMEGRRAGTEGEKRAYEYIKTQFAKTGLTPAFPGDSYLQVFEISTLKYIMPETKFSFASKELTLYSDFFPLSFSAEKAVNNTVSFYLNETGSAWIKDISGLLEKNKSNPHFDLNEALKEEAVAVSLKGAAALLLYDSGNNIDSLFFDQKSKSEAVSIPVVYIRQQGLKKLQVDDSASIYDVDMTIRFSNQKRTGHNVAGWINNGGAHTVVIGAHYDHLGYGEDQNSLHGAKEKEIHNGADDNASGTAAMIELASIIKKSGPKKYNYLFVAFSGEELGLFGSKYFVENPPLPIDKVNYMINMDMLGRLNDSSRLLTVGGVGTSPIWGYLLQDPGKYLKLRFDSSGTGPSDHTSFYRKDIPVLFFFTGLHTDYHKPGDDAEKINIEGQVEVVKLIKKVIEGAEGQDKMAFQKTREAAMGNKTSFRVTLGIMPDYTFSGEGVRADGVTEGRPAQKAGMRAGDIIIKIGDYGCKDIQAYMEALSKFRKGDAARVKLLRGNETLYLDIVF